MKWFLICDTGGKKMDFYRAYINISKNYGEMCQFGAPLNLLDLIQEVAKSNPYGDGDVQLYEPTTHEFFERRTKIFIVKKTKKYILGMPERFCPDENMATFVSLRQLKNLIKSFNCAQKRISCYSLIYLYVIYTLLEGRSQKANDCLMYLEALASIVRRYFENNPDDQLAVFFNGCVIPISRAINSRNTFLQNDQLPSVPRNHLRDDEQ